MAKSMICADSTENVGETVRFLLPLLPRHPFGEAPLAHFRERGYVLHPISEVISSQEVRQPLLGIDPYLQTAGGGLGQYYDPFEEVCPLEMVACIDELSTALNTHSNEMGWSLPEPTVMEEESSSCELEILEKKEEIPIVIDEERIVEEPVVFNDESTLQKVLADVYESHTTATIPVANLGRKAKVQLGLTVEKKVGKVVIDFPQNTIQVFPGRKKKSKDFQISEFFESRDWITMCGEEASRVEKSICRSDGEPFIDRKPKKLPVSPGEERLGVAYIHSEDGYRVAYNQHGKQLYKLKHLRHSDT